MIPDNSIQCTLCEYTIISLPEPRYIVIHAPMIAHYRQFNPLHILVIIPISQHYPSFVTARTKVVLAYEYRYYINRFVYSKAYLSFWAGPSRPYIYAASFRLVDVRPGDLTCLEDCPDVCVQNGGKFLFCPKVRERRDPPNGCKISQAPLYGYTFAINQHRDVLTIDIF